MKWAQLFLVSIFFALFLSLPAQAARIPEALVMQAERIDDTRSGAGPKGETAIVVDIESTGFPELITRSRLKNGSLGSSYDLSSTANAEIPRNVTFSAAGDLFLSWGVATTEARGEFAARSAAGSFSPTTTYTTPPCARFQSVSRKADGGLLIACSAESGIAPNNQVIFLTSLDSFLSTSFSAAVTAQAGTDDPFLQPRTSTAPDGSMAVAWATRRESAPGVYATRIRAITSGDGDWGGSPTTNLAFVNSASGYLSGAYPASLPGGKVAVLWSEGNSLDPTFGRLHLSILNPIGTIEADEIITTQPTGTYSLVREGNDLLLSWSEYDGGMGDPFTTKVARFIVGSGLSEETILESNSDFAIGDLQINSRGDVLLPRGDYDSLSAWVKRAGASSFSAPETIKDYTGSLSPDQRMSGTSLSLEESGDVFATWILADDAGENVDRVYWGGLDFTRPSLSLKTPKKIIKGKKKVYRARALDSSGIRVVRWKFAPGVVRQGSVVRYRYKKAGRYRISVTAVDRAGNKRGLSRTIRVR